MAKVPYQVEGHGKTTDEAERKHDESRTKLEQRLAQPGLTPEKKVFLAQYLIRSGVDLSNAESTEFTVRLEDPKKGWDAVLTAATKRAKPLTLADYTVTFTMESHYKITEEQAETSRKSHGGPSANYESGRGRSSVDSLRRVY